MATAYTLLAYLDPGNDNPAVWQLVVLAVALVVLLLVVLYALTRFVEWAARR